MSAPTPEPEICLNLWWFQDVTAHLVYRLAGRAYALSGDDDHKLSILKSLAGTDFQVARHFPVPQRLTVGTPAGEMEGVTRPEVIRLFQGDVFDEVFAALEKDLPAQIRTIANKPSAYRLNIPQKPLCCTTCVHEYEDGRLIPQIP